MGEMGSLKSSTNVLARDFCTSHSFCIFLTYWTEVAVFAQLAFLRLQRNKIF